MLGDAGGLPKSEVKTLMTPDHTAIHVRSTVYSRAGIGQSSGKVFDTGQHKKDPLPCPCRWLTAPHGAHQQMCQMYTELHLTQYIHHRLLCTLWALSNPGIMIEVTKTQTYITK